jgi:hypothetical protein
MIATTIMISTSVKADLLVVLIRIVFRVSVVFSFFCRREPDQATFII